MRVRDGVSSRLHLGAGLVAETTNTDADLKIANQLLVSVNLVFNSCSDWRHLILESPLRARRGKEGLVCGGSPARIPGARQRPHLESVRTPRFALQARPPPVFSLWSSYKSRNPRPGERDGIDYHFRTLSQIESLRVNNRYVLHGMVFTILLATHEIPCTHLWPCFEAQCLRVLKNGVPSFCLWSVDRPVSANGSRGLIGGRSAFSSKLERLINSYRTYRAVMRGKKKPRLTTAERSKSWATETSGLERRKSQRKRESSN
jgi:hypothetical protein